MKKTLALLLITTLAFAQKRDEKPFVSLGPVSPINTTYTDAHNCKIETDFTPSLAEGMRTNGVATDDLRLVVLGLSNKPEDADFVVKYKITRFEILETGTVDKQPAYRFGFEGNVRVYDRENKLVFQRYLIPTANTFLENSGVKLGQSLVNAVRMHYFNLMTDFAPYYLWQPVIATKSIGLTKLPKNSNLTDVNQSVEIFKNLISMKHSEWENAFKPAVDYWQTLKTYKDAKDEDVIKDVKLVANYNTGMAYLLQGKIQEAEAMLPIVKENDRKFLGMTSNADEFKKIITEVKESVELRKELAEINPIEAEPELKTYQKERDVFRFVEIIGTALDKNGKSWEGTIRLINDNPVSVDNRSGEGPQRSGLGSAISLLKSASADNSSVRIFMKDVKKPEKMGLDDIISIKTQDGKNYTVARVGSFLNNNLHYGLAEQTKGNAKIGLYQEIFPDMSSKFIKRPSDEKPFKYNPLSPTKSLQEYFVDCPAMMPFINNKEYKTYGNKLFEKLVEIYTTKSCGK